MELNYDLFGNRFHFHNYSGSNWSDCELSVISNIKAEKAAQRTTAIRGGFRCDRLVELFGDEDASDTCTVNGRTYHGRIVQGVNGGNHYISAMDVAYRAILAEQKRSLAKQASQAVLEVLPPAQEGNGPEAAAA